MVWKFVDRLDEQPVSFPQGYGQGKEDAVTWGGGSIEQDGLFHCSSTND